MPGPSRSIDWAVSGLAQLFDAVLTAAGRSGDLTESDREQFAETGAGAFTAGSSLSGLIDTYLGGAGELWEHVFTNADPTRAVELSRALRRVSEQAVSSLAAGFEEAQRLSIRAEESQRRAFLDDVLASNPDPTRLAEEARQVGFPTFDHVVVGAVAAQRHLNDGGPVQGRIKTELESRAPQRHFRVTAKGGRIVVIALDTTPSELARLCADAVGTVTDFEWRVGIGSAATELEGVGESFRHALDAVHIGETFDLASPTEFDRVLPERLLSADTSVTDALAETVIGPLTEKSSERFDGHAGVLFRPRREHGRSGSRPRHRRPHGGVPTRPDRGTHRLFPAHARRPIRTRACLPGPAFAPPLIEAATPPLTEAQWGAVASVSPAICARRSAQR